MSQDNRRIDEEEFIDLCQQIYSNIGKLPNNPQQAESALMQSLYLCVKEKFGYNDPRSGVLFNETYFDAVQRLLNKHNSDTFNWRKIAATYLLFKVSKEKEN